MALIKNSHAAGKTLVWTVPQPKVRIEGKVAWITYLNRGSMQDAAGQTSRGKIGNHLPGKEGYLPTSCPSRALVSSLLHHPQYFSDKHPLIQ